MKPPGSLTTKDRLRFLQLHNVKVGQSMIEDHMRHHVRAIQIFSAQYYKNNHYSTFYLAESMKRTNTLRLLHLQIMAWMAIEATTINNQRNSHTANSEHIYLAWGISSVLSPLPS